MCAVIGDNPGQAQRVNKWPASRSDPSPRGPLDPRRLFRALFEASTESEVQGIIAQVPEMGEQHNWRPYGQNESNYGVVENQQASAIPALVEKLINSIDAILTRKCLEERIDPKSRAAPRSIPDAVARFFPRSTDWDLPTLRHEQSESIQVIADGPRKETSLVIYDDGEGQHPEEFEATFLSLLRGNKNEIHFVQGKYNMGGAGALVFCGNQRYQLIGSRRWDNTGDFGFTLIRRHPLSARERMSKRATWYEYLVLNGAIPSFPTDSMDLGLRNRRFTTGTVIKLYSYDLPRGSRSVISRDLNLSLNEYLFDPALPLYTIDRPERYPKDRALQRDLYGLKRRLEEDGSKYVAEYFSEELTDRAMGSTKVTTYVFHSRVDDKSVRETRETIRREFFKNNMSVLFSMNGQVHGHYTTEFITRTLKYALLKHHLLIHVDCTHLNLDFRSELFMASRDRLKDGKEASALRRKLGELLRSGRLKEIYKARKAAVAVDSTDTQELLRRFTKNLRFRDDLMRLLGNTLDLPAPTTTGKRKRRKPRRKKGDDEPTFSGRRFPSYFRLKQRSGKAGIPMVSVPLGGKRTIQFATDVEDEYFDRVTEPGDLRIGLLDYVANGRKGSGGRLPSRVSEVLNVAKASPHQGTVRLIVNPTEEVAAGDVVKIQATLTGAGEEFEALFLVKITRAERKGPPKSKRKKPDINAGLPKLVRVYKEPGRGDASWDDVNVAIDMDYDVVVFPFVDNGILDSIYVNMDSHVFLKYRSKLATQQAIEIAEKRYLSGVYFHTLFLYSITHSRRYQMTRQSHENGDSQDVEVGEYLGDVFGSYYAEFLLTFEVQELIEALDA